MKLGRNELYLICCVNVLVLNIEIEIMKSRLKKSLIDLLKEDIFLLIRL
jgi:hypothetical protein